MALTLGGGSGSVSSRCHGCALPTQSPRPAARSPMWVAQAATHPEAESPPAASLWHQASHMLPKLGGGADTGQTFPAQREKRKRRQAGQAPTAAQTFRREDTLRLDARPPRGPQRPPSPPDTLGRHRNTHPTALRPGLQSPRPSHVRNSLIPSRCPEPGIGWGTRKPTSRGNRLSAGPAARSRMTPITRTHIGRGRGCARALGAP